MEQNASDQEEKELDDDEWSDFQEFDDPRLPTSAPIIPFQLHPTVLLSVKRMSSCCLTQMTDEDDVFALEDDASFSVGLGNPALLTFDKELKTFLQICLSQHPNEVFTFSNASAVLAALLEIE